MRNYVCLQKYVLKMNIKGESARNCHFSETMAWKVGPVNIWRGLEPSTFPEMRGLAERESE
jgi:hypothetical protein